MFGKIKCPKCGIISNSDYCMKNSGSVFCSEQCAKEFKGGIK